MLQIITSMEVLSTAEMKMTCDMMRQIHRLIWINVRIPHSSLQRETHVNTTLIGSEASKVV